MCVSCTSIWISNQSIPVKSIFSSLLNVHIRYPHDFFFFSFVLRVSVGRARSFGAELVTPLFLRLSFFFFFLSPIFLFHGWWFCFSFEFYSFRVIRTKFAALLLSEEVGLISPFLETRHIRFEATIASRKRLLLVSLKVGFMEIDQIC